MYSQDKINIALKVYHQCKSVTATIRILGYPSRYTLYTWITNEGADKPTRKKMNNIAAPKQPRHPSIEVKMDAIRRCFEEGESVHSVSQEIGYTRASIYGWRKKYLQGGTHALMNKRKIKPDFPKAEEILSPPDMVQLHAKMKDMQLEIDILKEIISILKTNSGIDHSFFRLSEQG